jgi:hypothetical protein
MKGVLTILTLLFFVSCITNKPASRGYSNNDNQGEITELSKSEIKEFFISAFSGVVIDQELNERLPFVHIELKNYSCKYRTASDSTGKFRIDNIRFGRYKIEVSYIGYYPLGDSIYIDPGKNNKYQIGLKLDPDCTL